MILKQKHCIAAIILLFGSMAAFGQKSYPEKSFEIGLGMEHMRMLDRQVSPLVYQSNLISAKTGFANLNPKRWVSLNFDLAPGALSARDFDQRSIIREYPDENGELQQETYELNVAPIIKQHLSFNYLHHLPITSQKFDFYAGAGLDENFMISFTPTAIFFFQNATINPSFGALYSLNENQFLTFKISSPLTGIVIRMPYANDPSDGKHGNFGSVYTMGTAWSNPSQFQKVSFDLAYSRLTNKKWNLKVQYQFEWMHYAPKRGTTSYSNQLSVFLTKKRISK